MKEVKAWKCNWCNRTSLNPANGRAHETSCKNNPARRHCITCTHGVTVRDMDVAKPLTVQSYMPGADNEPYVYDGPWCDLHKAPMSEKPYFFDCEEDEYDVFNGSYYEHVVRQCPGTCQGYEYKGCAKWGKPAEPKEAT